MPNSMAVSLKENYVFYRKELHFVIKFILTMSHEQAAVGRGFENRHIIRRCYGEKTGQKQLISKQLRTAYYPNH